MNSSTPYPRQTHLDIYKKLSLWRFLCGCFRIKKENLFYCAVMRSVKCQALLNDKVDSAATIGRPELTIEIRIEKKSFASQSAHVCVCLFSVASQNKVNTCNRESTVEIFPVRISKPKQTRQSQRRLNKVTSVREMTRKGEMG